MFKGKAIYQPKGKAGEYAQWACNFYVGCSNGCQYCYCKKGILAGVMGQDSPTLKKCFKSEPNALEVFEKELMSNIYELRKHGLFFSFTTDPMLPETKKLTIKAISCCIKNDVPVKVLTKVANWVDSLLLSIVAGIFYDKEKCNRLMAFGFTLTGRDDLEKGASTNAERIETMRKLHEAGFKTFASIEPIINFADSLAMIERSAPYCNLYKIGLKSGDKYHFESIRSFIEEVVDIVPNTPVYFKDSLLKQAGIERNDITRPDNFVTADYNIFNQ
jgi:DNA repair photolyase